MEYDIIGDIHGQAEKLYALLAEMGYRERGGVYRHPDRTAIFVGDFIDRGPRQMDCVMTVRRMVESGSALAIMGNHELNAIAWHMRDPYRDDYLRPRKGIKGLKNRAQHAAFLAEVERYPALHKNVVDWFLTLPLWIDLPELRVVHACWHEGYMNELRPHLTPDLQLTPDLMVSASQAGSMVFQTVEAMTKGLEIALPAGFKYHDKDGHPRTNVRIRWWECNQTTYRTLAMVPNSMKDRLPDMAIANDVRERYDGLKPVFFGHYWMRGCPALQSSMMACVDYSAAIDGLLVAYRWSGESQLEACNFVSSNGYRNASRDDIKSIMRPRIRARSTESSY